MSSIPEVELLLVYMLFSQKIKTVFLYGYESRNVWKKYKDILVFFFSQIFKNITKRY